MPGPAARISELRVENFLSIRSLRLRMGKFNVLVGPNASGKSNVAKAFMLLANCTRAGEQLLPGYASFKEVVHGFDETLKILVGLGLEVEGREVTCELALTRGDYTFMITSSEDGERPLLKERGSEPSYEYLDDGGVQRTGYKSGLPTLISLGAKLYPSVLASPPTDIARECLAVARVLKSMAVHSFVPESIRPASDIRKVPILGYRGERLARALLHLYLERREVFRRIEEALRSLVPEAEELIPHIRQGTDVVEIWLKTRHFDEPLRPANISDGTLRMLAFIVALYSGASLVVLEEPENSVHPHLLESLVDLIRQSPSQVVVTTQSPYLLDYVRPSEVFVVDKPGAETVIRRLEDSEEVKAVKEFLSEGGALGEAWYSGMFGGVPKGA